MEAAGQKRVVRAEDVAHMGITEVLRHAPYIFGQYRKLVGALKRERPEVAVLIDFPDVNFRLAKHCKRLGIPVLWFVSPQLWAWKRRRLRWVQQRVSKMLVIFPFEEEFYRNRGVDAEFVGHPLATPPGPSGSREQFAVNHMFSDPRNPESSSDLNKAWIALLPGSRWKEVKANLPTILEAAALLGPGYDFLIPVASTVDKGKLSEFIFRDLVPQIKWPLGSSITIVSDAREALSHSRVAVVASGTATVQALTIGNPFVVVYRVSRLTFAIAKRLVRYPAEIGAPGTLEDADGNLPIAMPNLIAGRRMVPELLNERFTAANLVAALRPLLEDTLARAQMIADLAETRAKLICVAREGKSADPIAAVCDAIESLLVLPDGPAARGAVTS